MKIHFVGVGGVGTGTLAKALSEQGHEVSGSDQALYEPMLSVLKQSGVKLLEGYLKSHVGELEGVELVIIGNVVTKENEEAVEWIRKGVAFCSFPEAIRRFLIGNKKSIVCAGTHGKTTTTTMAAFLLKYCDLHPSYLIGGVPKNLGPGCFLDTGSHFVVEGDEYDSAFFDKGPKFLHYHPHVAIISSVEFDHADIYENLEHVVRSFKKLSALVPGNGLLLLRHEDPNAKELVDYCHGQVETFGLNPQADWSIRNLVETENGFEFNIYYRDKLKVEDVRLPLLGKFNLANLLSAMVACHFVGAKFEEMKKHLSKFEGCRRRQEILKTSPFVLIDDFAHHPTEVKATLEAVKSRYGQRTIWAFFEPRSATARSGKQQDLYSEAFGDASKIVIAQPYHKEKASFRSDALVEALNQQGKQAYTFETVQEMVRLFEKEHNKGDVAVVMSNGEFGKIQTHLSLLGS